MDRLPLSFLKVKRVLILTAGFGEGHNTASRCIAEALGEHPGTDTKVVDVYMETIPRFTKVLQSGYGLAINKFPFIWSAIFTLLDKPGKLEATLPLAANLRNALRRVVEEYRPDVIVSTYPLYAYLLLELRKAGHEPSKAHLLTMVTDSTAVNSSWYRGGSDAFLVADAETAAVLEGGGVDPSRIHVLGFPVTPRLASLKPLEPVIHGSRRLLYLPSSRVGHSLAVIRALQALPDIELTIVTGKLHGLHAALVKSGVADGIRTHLVGWTDKIPELLCGHHLFIGKAGGAIVQEAIAACCPILVSHVVPGQEEGNIEMIERHDIGRLAAHGPEMLAVSVQEVFANDASTWKRWKKNIASISKPASSRDIAAFILQMASTGSAASSAQSA
jgi:processive 1,2-diacylglycerol beta-glucosyltransferase